MVWDHNAQTIVLLSSLDDSVSFRSKPKIYSKSVYTIKPIVFPQTSPQFWPEESIPIVTNYYRVKYESKINKCDYISRDFVIQSIQDDYELSVRMLHCPNWPELGHPAAIFDFIVDVHQRSNEYKNGPIIVVDK